MTNRERIILWDDAHKAFERAARDYGVSTFAHNSEMAQDAMDRMVYWDNELSNLSNVTELEQHDA